MSALVLRAAKGRLELGVVRKNSGGKTERRALLAALTPATKHDARQRTRMTANDKVLTCLLKSNTLTTGHT